MSFHLPDDILEKLRCDYCLRYLSVGPVLVNGNRKKICGRCSKNGKRGIVSIFNVLGKHSLYKCINRFDGCNAWLAQEKVLKHEETCISKEFSCPLCGNDRKMATYILLQHFRTNHCFSWLAKPYFEKKISKLNEENFYIYIKNDTIFLIYLQYQIIRKVFLLNVIYVGDEIRVKDMLHQFNVYVDGITIFKSEAAVCSSFNPEFRSFCVEIHMLKNLSDSSQMNVHFDIQFPRIYEFGVYKCLQQEDFELTHFAKTGRQLKIKEEYSSLVQALNITISTCGTQLIKVHDEKNIEINIACFFCSKISLKSATYIEHDSCIHLICELCSILLNSWIMIELKKIGDGNILYYLLCSCLGGCGYFGECDVISSHEQACQHTRKKECPMEKTCDFKGNFVNMKTHFKVVHKLDLFNDMFSYSDLGTYYVWVNELNIIRCTISPSDWGGFQIYADFGNSKPKSNIRVLLYRNCGDAYFIEDKEIIGQHQLLSGSFLRFFADLF